MKIRKDAVWLDKPTKKIHIYGAEIQKVNQDKLDRVHITVKKKVVDRCQQK